jgi:hypothetical protein
MVNDKRAGTVISRSADTELLELTRNDYFRVRSRPSCTRWTAENVRAARQGNHVRTQIQGVMTQVCANSMDGWGCS